MAGQGLWPRVLSVPGEPFLDAFILRAKPLNPRWGQHAIDRCVVLCAPGRFFGGHKAVAASANAATALRIANGSFGRVATRWRLSEGRVVM